MINFKLTNFNLYLIISLNLNLINFCNSSNITIFLSFNFINFKLTNFHPSYVIIFLNFLQLFNNSNQFSIKFHN